MRVRLLKRGTKAKKEKFSKILKNGKIIIKTSDDRIKILGNEIIAEKNNQISNFQINKIDRNTFEIIYSDETTKPINSINQLLDIGVIMANWDEIYIESKEFDKYIFTTLSYLIFISIAIFLIGFLIGRR
ncbi:MAG: hypothetical protein ABIL47_07990 [candidate division WOR-3 bacterium]